MAWGAGRETEMQDYEMHVYDENTAKDYMATMHAPRPLSNEALEGWAKVVCSALTNVEIHTIRIDYAGLSDIIMLSGKTSDWIEFHNKHARKIEAQRW